MNYLILIIFIIIFLLILYNIDNKCENSIYYLLKRKIKIFVPDAQMSNIKKIIESYKEEFDLRNVDIEYTVSLSFKAELYGYDGTLKKIITTIEQIRDFISDIDNMPMGSLEKKERENFYKDVNNSYDRKQLLKKCGLPDIPATSHCFSDSTHHTCCLLGSRAREYADNSGNPIGKASINALARIPNEGELVPWCTCTGSKVCSYYKNEFNDGTNIKFIGNTNIINEDEGINMLNIIRHKTPGVKS
jgi:hypothetical protein